MDHQSRYLSPEIKISNYEDKFFRTEIVQGHHMLIWFVSGQTKIMQADACYTFRSGDIFLIPGNQMATLINYPTDHRPHKTIIMYLSATRLREFYKGVRTQPLVNASGKIRLYGDHSLLESCFASLIPYFQLTQPLPEEVASIKITEAISILRLIDEDIDSVLTNGLQNNSYEHHPIQQQK